MWPFVFLPDTFASDICIFYRIDIAAQVGYAKVVIIASVAQCIALHDATRHSASTPSTMLFPDVAVIQTRNTRLRASTNPDLQNLICLTANGRNLREPRLPRIRSDAHTVCAFAEC
jgi:hypothetical protein